MLFTSAVKGKLRVDVYGVIPVKMNQAFRIQKGSGNFSRIARMDISHFD